ncbi:MAG: hypothetical protein GY751_19910 [Bacteroidetes bacterium]|nr:hypothetical protein [Bacteroidota bacterium]
MITVVLEQNPEDILLSYLVTEEGDEEYSILPVIQQVILSYFPEGEKVNITQLSPAIMACAAEIQMSVEGLDPELDPDFMAPLIQELVAASLGLKRLWKVIARYGDNEHLASLI